MNVKILGLILLALISCNTWSDYLPIPGIDFYHYWGVAKAQQLSPSPLVSPYVAADTYADVLNQHVEMTEDPILKDANAYRRTLDLTGTPLLYTFFALLPERYTQAIVSFRFLQLILFILAIYLIGILQGCADNFLTLALALSITFLPFLIDLRVGNLNTIQLFLVVISILLVDRANGYRLRQRLYSGLFAVCLFIFITLIKPNLILTMLALSISFVVRYGVPKLTVLAPASMAFSALLILLTSVFLGSSRVWLDWYELVSISQDRLVYPLESGNYSTPLLITQLYNINLSAATIAVAVFLVISLGGVILMSAFKAGMVVENSLNGVRHLFRDTGLAASIAITVTIALSPLVWPHYYTLLLLPALWMINTRRYGKRASWLSLLAIACSGGIVLQLSSLWLIPSPELQATSFILGWVLVWARILFVVLNLSNKKSSGAGLATA